MQYKPNKNTQPAWILLGISTSLAILFYVLGAFSLGILWINQLFMLLFLVLSTLILVRYVLVDYVYCVNENGYLTVTRVYGKNTRIVADIRMSASDELLTKKEFEKQKEKIDRLENFCLSIRAKTVYYYVFSNKTERNALLLECQPDVADFIARAIEIFGPEHDQADQNQDD
jgi:hypothetical protein